MDRLTRDELLDKLRECADNSDFEMAHGDADDALIAYIADDEIAEAFESVGKWYA